MRTLRRDGALFVIGRLVPPGADAITLGRLVLVRRGHESSEYLLEHELVHVRQYRERGFFGFLVRYVGRYLLLRLDGWPHLAAYRRLPAEAAADWGARRRLGWGVVEADARPPAPSGESLPA